MEREPERHLLVADGRVHPAGMLVLRDRDRLIRFVRKLAMRIEITELDLMARVIGPDVEGGPGLSVVNMITTSHIAVHTFPRHGCFQLDISSSREFDPLEAVDFTRTELDVHNWKTLMSWPKLLMFTELPAIEE